MNRLLLFFSLSLFTISCGQSVLNNSVNKDTLIVKRDNAVEQEDTSGRDKNNSSPKVAQTWTDSLIEGYIHNSNNALIRQSLKNKISEEWLFDQTISTDTGKYFTF